MKAIVILAVFSLMHIRVCGQWRKLSFQQPKMGSLFSIVIYSSDSAAAAKAATDAFLLIDTLNSVYSDYLPESELNQLCRTAGSGRWIKVSETLFSILRDAYQASVISEGSFDITAGPLIRLWRTARREKRLPDPDSLAQARRCVGYRLMALDTHATAVNLKVRGMQLDLGGIAKGETAQRVYERLRETGFPHALLDAGGDIVAGTVPPGVEGWRVSINVPGSEDLMQERLLLTDKAVTTSGNLYQFVELQGKRYSHIIDPASGIALTHSRNVTVISDRGQPADWLTKACSILPLRKAMKLVAGFPGTEVQIGVLKNGRPAFYRSAGFSAYFEKG